METCRSPKQSTYEISGPVCLLALLILLVVIFTPGCANVTIVKLAELCHAHEGKPSVTFSGETGKSECK